ncbi:hypothetical protein V8C86DRAFT_2665121 [Haematococcus lacustris]
MTSTKLWSSLLLLLPALVLGYQNSFFGAWLPSSGQPVGPVTPVRIACLESRAPAPFNYKMRCPDTAQISEFYDDQGVYHRIIDHAPLPNVTSAMMKWWFSPALAVGNPFIKFRGETVYWYKLWHPLDHKALLPAALPAPSFPLIPSIWVIVKESYRKLASEPGQPYTIDAPVFVADGRFGIQLRGPGGVVVASFLNLPWKDSPEGLRLRTELIIGIGNRGPAQRLNQFTLEVVRDQFPGLSDQVTRHHIEEVGNFADFLPELFAQYGPGSRLTRLAALG